MADPQYIDVDDPWQTILDLAAERDKLAARVLRLESIGAVRAVAGPLQVKVDEARRLLQGALDGHAADDRTFTRGEMADLEAALRVLRGDRG